MSLAPAEQRALDRIEFALYGSDRRLAHTLSRFKLPLARGGLAIMVRKPRRRKPVIVAAIVVMALALLAVAVWDGPARPPTCSTASGTGPAVTATQASDCTVPRNYRLFAW